MRSFFLNNLIWYKMNYKNIKYYVDVVCVKMNKINKFDLVIRFQFFYVRKNVSFCFFLNLFDLLSCYFPFFSFIYIYIIPTLKYFNKYSKLYKRGCIRSHLIYWLSIETFLRLVCSAHRITRRSKILVQRQ